MKLSLAGEGYFLYDKVDDYVKSQSKLIRDLEFNSKNVELNEILTGKRESKEHNLLKMEYKCAFPSQHQLQQLDLRQGQNEIKFVCQTSPNGVQTLSSYIYLWPYNSKIIITDVDGTITKSDVLGQVLPFFGKDWSHPGVTALFRNLYNNGYKIAYLTARAIGQSAMTKNYLMNLIQNKQTLPPGPLFMSPDGLFASLRREVIEKKPHLLKIPLLFELNNLFVDKLPHFHAGFGNRETDAVSYMYLQIPLNKCFIINTSSEVVQLGSTVKTTYQEIADNIDKYFQKIEKKENNENNEEIKTDENLINKKDNIIPSKEDENGTISFSGTS